MIMHKAILLFITMLWALSGQAQDNGGIQSSVSDSLGKDRQIDVGLQLLVQGEVRNGGLDPNQAEEDGSNADDHANFVMERTRLIIGYKQPSLETKLTMQHIGVWGEGGRGTTNVYEAWAKLSANCGLFAQIGRQVLSYDDERIIGPDDWAMAASSHDVLRLGYEGHNHQAHLILAYNQNGANTEGGTYYSGGAQPYKTMQTLWYHYDVPKTALGASLLFMNIGMQAGTPDDDPHTEHQQLLGGYVKYAPKYWQLEGSYYRQMGKDENGMDIKAWMASIKAEWKPTDRYSMEAGYDYLSGDEYFAVPSHGAIGLTQHTVIRGFSTVYGSHHKFYGAMDFFYVTTYVNGFSPGLQNLYWGNTYKPMNNLSLTARYHYMGITADLTDIDKTLGHEIELEASYNFMKDVKLDAGFTYMTGTKTMERLKRASGDGRLCWGWISLVISPHLFSTKW